MEQAHARVASSVKIQRRSDANWRTVGKDRTSANGSYREGLPDREGKYRSVVSRSRLANRDICLGDVSRRRAHNHPTIVDGGGGDGGGVPNCTPGYSPCLVYHGSIRVVVDTRSRRNFNHAPARRDVLRYRAAAQCGICQLESQARHSTHQ